MPRTDPAIEVKCPECGAEAGRACRLSRRRKKDRRGFRFTVHRARINAYVRSGKVDIGDREDEQ